MLAGPLDAGGDAFGGDHWADEYAAIREGNVMLAVLPTATELSDAERSATSGYVKTLQALNYLIVLNAHTQDSIPIVTDTSVTAPPAPFQTNAAAFEHVVDLLEQAKAELQAGGSAFPFSCRPASMDSIPRPPSSPSIARCSRGSRCTGATSPAHSPP